MKWKRGSFERREADISPDDAPVSVDEDAVEISLDEMREFLEADLVDVRADPEFKYSLRNRLWDLVQARNAMRHRSQGRN